MIFSFLCRLLPRSVPRPSRLFAASVPGDTVPRICSGMLVSRDHWPAVYDGLWSTHGVSHTARAPSLLIESFSLAGLVRTACNLINVQLLVFPFII